VICATKKLRPPLKWHGGKAYLARRIIGQFIDHRVYIEPFLGGGSVLLNKPPSPVEVAGDTDADLMNFWAELQRDLFDNRLLADIRDLPYAEEIFSRAKKARALGNLPAHSNASTFLVANRFSRGGLGKDFAWSDRLRGGQPGDVNAWETIKAGMPRIGVRIMGVTFRTGPAVATIREFDAPDALIYCDPPYLHSTRSVPDAYRHEMTEAQHVELLETLLACRGAVYLSGYRSDLYDRMLAGWRRVEFDMPNHSGQGKAKQRRVECLWIKPR
jgi:DNA adenine methylase